MTERELSQAVHLKAELDALRRVAALEPNPENRNIPADGGPII